MELRIAMAGPSGTGKTTLSKYIEETFKIPFITTSTKPLWDKWKINSHAHLIQKTLVEPVWGLEFQYDVLNYRYKILKDHKEFVTDRSPLDNLAYFLMQNSSSCTERETENYMKACKEAFNLFTGLLVLPYTDQIKLEDDGMRVPNKYYQMYTNEIFILASKMMTTELRRLHGDTLMMWNMDERILATNNLLNKIISHV